MTYVDPRAEEATRNFWEAAVEQRAAESIINALAVWRAKYFLRREKAHVIDLPPKTQASLPIPLFREDYLSYDRSEEKCIAMMKSLAGLLDKNRSPTRAAQKLAVCILSTISVMRIPLIHTIIANQGVTSRSLKVAYMQQ